MRRSFLGTPRSVNGNSTFSSAVSHGNRLGSWNTTPTRSGSGTSIGAPLIKIVPRGLRTQPGHHHQQRRLSAAARTDQHDKTAGLDLDRYVGQRHKVLAGGLVDLADTGDLNRACARRRLERGYVRQWLHRVSTHLTSSLKAMAIAPIIRTPASNCFI